jgi:hypothetical protein
VYDDELGPGDYSTSEPDPVAPLTEGGGLNPPIDWWMLSESERRAQLNRAWSFTQRLVRYYRLPGEIVPPCWFRHDEMVQELLALMQFRNEQQFIEQQSPGAALDFHHHLGLWITRMRGWVLEAGCKPNEHLEKAHPMWVVPDSSAAVAVERDFDELLRRTANQE